MNKKYKFIKIKANYLGDKDNTYWALLVENMIDLFRYFEAKNPQLVKAYFEIKKKKSFGHCIGNEQVAVETLFIADNNSKTVADDIIIISDTFSKPKIREIINGNKLIINPSGIGFCRFDEKYHTILQTIESDDFNFPCNVDYDDIIVKQWQNGKHWYVRVGQYDLPDKYFSYELGFKAGKEYLERKLNGV